MSNMELALEICTDQLLIPFEGYHKKLPNGDCQAYPDPATGGKPFTIGYGSTQHPNGTPVTPGEIWTKAYAVKVKQAVLVGFLKGLLALSPGLQTEEPQRIAAILSWVYNCGLGNYRISTFRKKVNEKNWQEAARQLQKWNKANGKVMRGLTKRRYAEAVMLLSVNH